MKKILGSLVLALLSITAIASSSVDAVVAGLSDIKKNPVRLLLVHSERCSYCKKFHNETKPFMASELAAYGYSLSELQELDLANKNDYETHSEYLSSGVLKGSVSSVPLLVILDSNGVEKHGGNHCRIVGFMRPDELVKKLIEMVPRCS